MAPIISMESCPNHNLSGLLMSFKWDFNWFWPKMARAKSTWRTLVTKKKRRAVLGGTKPWTKFTQFHYCLVKMPRSFAPFMGPFTWRECSKIKWESGNVAREGQLICLKGVVTRQNKNRCLTLAMAKHHVAPKKLVQSHPKRFFLGWNIHKKRSHPSLATVLRHPVPNQGFETNLSVFVSSGQMFEQTQVKQTGSQPTLIVCWK
jgi:hypothetical protein